MTKQRADLPKSFRFTADEMALLERMAKKYGSPKGAVLAGLSALEAEGKPNWPAALRKLAKELEVKR